MHTRAGRIVVACCVLCAVVGIAVAVGIGAGAATQEEGPRVLSDTGRFLLGAELGEERAGFSGLPKLQVFADAGDPNWPIVQQCLLSAEVAPLLASFTPILIDAGGDATSERALRVQGGWQVVIRDLSGEVLGGLAAGFRCEDLARLLENARDRQAIPPQKSPIYSALLFDSAAIDTYVATDQLARAHRFADMLEEFEGPASPVVQAVNARLGR